MAQNQGKEIVALGADHAGFALKEAIKQYLNQSGFGVEDMGCASTDSVDYPDFAAAVAKRVSGKQARAGVLVCNTGIGMSIAANKVAGVRAALVSDPHTAQMSREHNDANVLVLGAKDMEPGRAIEIVKAWFAAQFQGGRHARRVDKIKDLENGKGGLC